MTRTHLNSHLRRLKLCVGCAFILAALAFTQHKDDADDQAVRAHEQAQGVRPVEWIDLEKVADAMSALEISKTTRRMK